MAGRGSLAGLMPYGDANAIVVDMAREVLPVVRDMPVLAGVCGTDPFRDIPRFLRELRDMGFAGVQNFPTVALYRRQLQAGPRGDRHGLRRSRSAMASEAKALDMLTAMYCVTRGRGARHGIGRCRRRRRPHGPDDEGPSRRPDVDEPGRGRRWRSRRSRDVVHEVDPTVIVLCHGGPLAEVEDVRDVLGRTTGVAGFFGASSMERLPTEIAIRDTVRRFKDL